PDFDVIVAGEVIEHLNNPGLFLTGVKKLMSPDTKLLITTVNAYCGFRGIYYALRGRRGVAEPIHPDHISYYSYSTLRHLLDRHDLRVENFLYYDIGVEHRKFSRKPLLWLNDICVRLAPQLADGLIAVCTLD
ncbi:MAG: methyltransferase domain-containing protein, partial [Acidobacteria bacterium]|nr:methyltransferase domain-containing protein [Acidobacteriota bacterium]